jgi:hypothetical protein
MVVRRGRGTTYKSIRLSRIVVTVRCNPSSTTIGPSRCAALGGRLPLAGLARLTLHDRQFYVSLVLG